MPGISAAAWAHPIHQAAKQVGSGRSTDLMSGRALSRNDKSTVPVAASATATVSGVSKAHSTTPRKMVAVVTIGTVASTNLPM